MAVAQGDLRGTSSSTLVRGAGRCLPPRRGRVALGAAVDLRQYGISAAELNSHGIAMQTLKEAGYPLNEAGYLAREAGKAGYSNLEIEQSCDVRITSPQEARSEALAQSY
jgi:hypothetical protein